MYIWEPKVVLGTVIAIPVKVGPSYEELVAENARLQARIGHLEGISALSMDDRRFGTFTASERRWIIDEMVRPLMAACNALLEQVDVKVTFQGAAGHFGQPAKLARDALAAVEADLEQ